MGRVEGIWLQAEHLERCLWDLYLMCIIPGD